MENGKPSAVLSVIGGGLAGCEAAWQAAERGVRVKLHEMRPSVMTGAHTGGDLAELVCSNSLGSALMDRATGLLQHEMRRMGGMLIACADQARLPAGGALAVDRSRFSRLVADHLDGHPFIEIVREEVRTLPEGPCVLATGPLTSPALASELENAFGKAGLFFFDALAPIVAAESIDQSIAFRASRYNRGDGDEGDYLNCPMNRSEYEAFIDALLSAGRIELKSFEQALAGGVRAGKGALFEGCLPVEILAGRGREALAFGPLRPVGLVDPRTGKRPHAVLQLRQDDLAAALYNLVGFQTNLRHPEQERVFRMIPGLERAEFVRYGQMHRNTYLCAPQILLPTLQCRERPNLFVAGQLAGIEGYAGNIASGLLAGCNAARQMQGQALIEWPATTMSGALMRYIAQAPAERFQPMKANFGILPELTSRARLGKRERAAAYAARAMQELETALPAD